MVRMWIVKYNQGSIDPLLSRPKGGRKREISLQRLEDMLLPVLKDPQQAAVGHWTDVKVHGWLQQLFQIELSYSTVVRYLHDQNLHLRVPRP